MIDSLKIMDYKQFRDEQKRKIVLSIMCDGTEKTSLELFNQTHETFFVHGLLLFAILIPISILFALALIIHKLS